MYKKLGIIVLLFLANLVSVVAAEEGDPELKSTSRLTAQQYLDDRCLNYDVPKQRLARLIDERNRFSDLGLVHLVPLVLNPMHQLSADLSLDTRFGIALGQLSHETEGLPELLKDPARLQMMVYIDYHLMHVLATNFQLLPSKKATEEALASVTPAETIDDVSALEAKRTVLRGLVKDGSLGRFVDGFIRDKESGKKARTSRYVQQALCEAVGVDMEAAVSSIINSADYLKDAFGGEDYLETLGEVVREGKKQKPSPAVKGKRVRAARAMEADEKKDRDVVAGVQADDPNVDPDILRQLLAMSAPAAVARAEEEPVYGPNVDVDILQQLLAISALAVAAPPPAAAAPAPAQPPSAPTRHVSERWFGDVVTKGDTNSVSVKVDFDRIGKGIERGVGRLFGRRR